VCGKNQPPFYCEDVQLMYDKIMTEKLNPKKIDEVATNLLQQVRARTPTSSTYDLFLASIYIFISLGII
jgi:hypothetical protein